MIKKIVRFEKNSAPYVKGDLTFIENELTYQRLKKLGVVVDAFDYGDELKNAAPFIAPLTGKNLYGKRYTKGKVDVVIPTASEETKTFIPPSKHLNQVMKVVRRFSPEVGGFAKAVNDGARMNKATSEFILFLNDDATLKAGFFEEAIKEFRDPLVAIVGNRSSDCGHFINGSIMLVRREIFERVGGFDDNYFFMWEDNDICKKITERGYKWVVSQAPAEHVGKESVNTESEFWRVNYFNGEARYKAKWKNKRRIVGAMIVGNEEGRYLELTVNDLFERGLVDSMVITLDAPTDRTAEICRELAKQWNINIHEHPESLFGKGEAELRERTIDYAIAQNPYGIITVDSDEVFDKDVTRERLEKWLEEGIAWDFYIAHYWKNQTEVRLDGLFGHQKNVRLFRYDRTKRQEFYDKPVHCGSAPVYAYEERRTTDCVFLHYGYASEKDVQDRIERYAKLDPNGYYESKNFYNQFKSEAITAPFNKKDFINNWNK